LIAPPYEKTGRGWGTFGVKVTVHWMNGEQTNYVHELKFDQDKSEMQVDVILKDFV